MTYTIDQVKEQQRELSALIAERNALLTEIEKIYLLEDSAIVDDPQQGIKRTLSTDGRDKVLGVVRIMTAAEPRFHCATDTGLSQARASKLEQLCTELWRAGGKLRGTPLHYTVALAATLYGECHIAVEDALSAADANDERAKRAAAQSPVIFRVINPQYGWPVYDQYGLAGYYSEQQMQWYQIAARFNVTDIASRNPHDHETVCEWWDSKNQYIWIDGGETLAAREHGLPCIPIAATVIEGGELFENGTYTSLTRQPFLYGMHKSGLWKRQNLYMTVLYSQAFSLGRYNKLLYHANQEGKTPPDIDNSGNSIVTVGPGESISPLLTQIIDPSLSEAGRFAFEKGEATTLYSQVLGQPMGSGVAFSTVSLLSQAGRLPIIPIQRMAGHVIAQACNNALALLKRRGKKITLNGATVNASDIPDYPVIECELEANLPQDDRLNAMVAAQLTQGDNPLVSMEWARTNVLKIEQPDVIDQQIVNERAAQIGVMKELARQLQEAQAMLQQAQQPPQMQQPGAPMPGQMPAGPQGMPPGMQMPGAQGTGAMMGAPGIPMGEPMERGGMPPMMEGDNGYSEGA